MTWRHIKTEYPVARKDYGCGAWPWLDADVDFYREAMTVEDEAILDKAISERCMIRKGEKYLKVTGVWEGEIQTNKYRIDLDKLCSKYEAYEYD